MPLPVHIRAFCERDAPTVSLTFFRSIRESGLRHYSQAQVEAWAPALPDPAEVHRRAADGRVCLVAESEGQVVGYGDLEANGHIDHLYCLPEVCGKGVASQLLQHLITIAEGRSLPHIFVEASAGARGLFTRNGFATVARRNFELRGIPIFNYAMRRLCRERLRRLFPREYL